MIEKSTIKQPVYAIEKQTLLNLSSKALVEYPRPLSFGVIYHDDLISTLNQLPYVDDKIHVAAVARFLKENETTQMLASANSGIDALIAWINKHRIEIS